MAELDLYDTSIRGAAAPDLASALAQHTSLVSLDLGNSNLGDDDATTIEGSSPEWKAFFQSLAHHTSLVKLTLSFAGIEDESATIIVQALASSYKLEVLSVRENDCSAAIFSTLLRNPNSALKMLDLSHTRIDDEGTLAFADALVGNSALHRLHLGGVTTHFTTTGMDAFTQLLGNKASIMGTFNSNHTLHTMGGPLGERNGSDELVNLLKMSKCGDKSEVARQKILLLHFSGDNMDIQAFVGMELNVLPQALSWAGRDDDGHSLLYELVRGMPSMTEHGNAVQDFVSGKRKRAL